MQLLLDTHALLWALTDDPSLPVSIRHDIETASTVYVSAVNVWEIAIKRGLGRLRAPDDLLEQVRTARFEPLPVTLPHALAVEDLPRHHHDPFDRLLIAQAVTDGLALVTRDREIRRYDVTVVWDDHARSEP